MLAKRFMARYKPTERRGAPAPSMVSTRPAHPVKPRPSRFSKFLRYTRITRNTDAKDQNLALRKSLADLVSEEMSRLNRTLYYQRVFIIARNKENMQIGTTIVDDEVVPIYKFDETNYHLFFGNLIEKSMDDVIENTFSEDPVTGLFVNMKEYTILIVESTEDQVAIFLTSLAKKVKDCWSDDRVLFVDDNIAKTFFDKFIYRSANSINVNEKFTPGVPHDERLMGIQHCKLRDKMMGLCRKVSLETRLSGELLKPQLSSTSLEHLAPETFNKYLPEVQRIELLLQSTRFYHTLDGFIDMYDEVPDPEDDELLCWPIPYNYVPMKPFKRMDWDFNLTFAGYGRGEGLTLDESDEDDSDYGEDFDLPMSRLPSSRYARIMDEEEEEEEEELPMEESDDGEEEEEAEGEDEGEGEGEGEELLGEGREPSVTKDGSLRQSGMSARTSDVPRRKKDDVVTQVEIDAHRESLRRNQTN